MKLIKTQDKFILVNDEEIKYDDYFFDNNIGLTGQYFQGYMDFTFCNKIIAGVEFLPKVDLSLLSAEDCKEIGYVDVEKLAKEKYPRLINDPYNPQDDDNKEGRDIWIDGFKSAQSLNDNRFSLEDMRRCYEGVLQNVGTCVKQSDLPTSNDYIQSLQKTEWDVEVEMECGEERQCECDDNSQCLKPQPKITNNSIKITKLL